MYGGYANSATRSFIGRCNIKRQDNPELKRRILKHLAHIYKIDEVREVNHLSTYVYCRTKAFLSQKQATEPTDEEVMLFALGYGLQDVLTPKGATAPVYKQEGIIYRPDMSFQPLLTEIEQLVELKTTRKSAKYHYIDEHLPETWLDYMKGGCKLRGVNEYDLIVLYMMGGYSPPFPQIYCDRFTFTADEIEQNWQKLLKQKAVLDEALATDTMPTPFQNNYDWECRFCRFLTVCQVLGQVSSRGLEEDKGRWK